MGGYRKNKTSEPGYRYAKERERYMGMTPEERRKVREWLEAVWRDRSCNAVRKNKVPCLRIPREEKENG